MVATRRAADRLRAALEDHQAERGSHCPEAKHLHAARCSCGVVRYAEATFGTVYAVLTNPRTPVAADSGLAVMAEWQRVPGTRSL